MAGTMGARAAMKVSETTYLRITEVKHSLEAYEKREVTYSETLDMLVRHWESTGELIRDAIKGTR